MDNRTFYLRLRTIRFIELTIEWLMLSAFWYLDWKLAWGLWLMGILGESFMYNTGEYKEIRENLVARINHENKTL